MYGCICDDMCTTVGYIDYNLIHDQEVLWIGVSSYLGRGILLLGGFNILYESNGVFLHTVPY